MAGKDSKYQYLLEFLLFSGLACFSLFFLGNYADIPSEKLSRVLDRKDILLFFIIVFNGIGLSMTCMGRKIGKLQNRFLHDRKQLILLFILSAILLFALNYLLLAAVKWMLGAQHPFRLVWLGAKTLIAIWLVELVVVSQSQVNAFHRKTLELYKRTSELEKSALRVQYKALQSQLNPHFLFNSLNTLISEIEYNPSNAVRFTSNLSDVYRYILRFQEQQLVSLRSELDFLQGYIYLHKVRLGDYLSVDCQIPESYLDDQLPPLTLQLLAENIIKHNMFYAGKPITIHIKVEPNEEYLVVRNELRPKLDVPSSGKGLQNLSMRYRLLCEKDIIVEKSELFFTVKVPLLNHE
jgi:two-component system LytT family sensor kinase